MATPTSFPCSVKHTISTVTGTSVPTLPLPFPKERSYHLCKQDPPDHKPKSKSFKVLWCYGFFTCNPGLFSTYLQSPPPQWHKSLPSWSSSYSSSTSTSFWVLLHYFQILRHQPEVHLPGHQALTVSGLVPVPCRHLHALYQPPPPPGPASAATDGYCSD